MSRTAERRRFCCVPAKTPSGIEVRTLLKHLTRRIRRHWPRTGLAVRGDSHYGRAEAMAWCEANDVDQIFGLAGNSALHALAYAVGDDVKVRRAEAGVDRIRGFASFDYAAGSWNRERRVVRRRVRHPRGFGDTGHLRRAVPDVCWTRHNSHPRIDSAARDSQPTGTNDCGINR